MTGPREGGLVATGDERFAALFQANYGDILAYALRRCPTRQDAEDVVAETFAVAWRRLADVPDDEQARPWLFRTAHLVHRNQERSAGRRRSLTDRLGQATMPSDADEFDATMSALSYEPGRDSAVGRALEALAAPDREVLLLMVWEELTAEEVSAILEISISAVWKRSQRARERLAAALARQTVSHPPESPAWGPARKGS
jgi:RNA polymerase sigma-70 factor (ECF subfamily)